MKQRNVGLVTCAILLAASFAQAADVFGTWECTMDFQGTEIPATITLTKGDDGIEGTWTGRRGDSPLENIECDGTNLSFTRTVNMQGQEYELAFTGTIADGKLTGEFDTPMGALALTGALAGGTDTGGLAGLAGTWNAHVSSGLGDFEREIVINEDGTGTYEGSDSDYAITDVKLDGSDVTFAVTIQIEGEDLPLTFEGTLDGSSLDGEFISDLGNGTVSATKAGGGLAALAGLWDASVSSGLGDFDHQFKFNDDGTGLYLGDDDVTYDLTNVALDGSAVTFAMTIDVEGSELALTFEGTLDGSSLDGEFISDLGNGAVSATKVGGGGGDADTILALLKSTMELLGNQDVEGMMAVYSEDFSSDQGDKAGMLEFLIGAKEQGLLEDMEIVMDDLTIEVDGDTATVEGIELEGAFGVLTLEFELAKTDGKWLITSQMQY